MKNFLLILLGVVLGAGLHYGYGMLLTQSVRANLDAQLAEYCENLSKQK